jgi:hypothetical protein
MNDNSWSNELLSDVLCEADTPFRADSLDQMLGEVQWSRGRQRRNRVLIAAVCIFIVIGVVVCIAPKQNLPVRTDPLLVHSEPLSRSMIVATQPGLVTTVNSSGYSIALVEPMPAEKLFEFIGDDQLLALLGSRPAALVHHGTSAAELVFLNPADADGFPLP